jgi:glucan phosphoethanolaminetransferase (alkaline phosphatase superfamily)
MYVDERVVEKSAFYFYYVSWIAAFAILYFLSSLIVIRKLPDLYSERIFQVANRKSFFRLLLVFIVLIYSIFFFFRNKAFIRRRGINPSHNVTGHVLVVTLQAASQTVAVSFLTGIKRCV